MIDPNNDVGRGPAAAVKPYPEARGQTVVDPPVVKTDEAKANEAKAAEAKAAEPTGYAMIVAHWFNDHVANSPVSRSTEAVNHLTQNAMPKLIDMLNAKKG